MSEIKKALAPPSSCFVFANIANPDMIGHTGNITSAIYALEIVDWALGEIGKAVRSSGGMLLITGDHGNVEEMMDAEDGVFSTHHSKNPVPFLLWIHPKKNFSLRHDGALSDVAPTILELLHVGKPTEMTGKSLLNKKKHNVNRNKKTS